MPRRILLHDPPERFIVGTVGPPGERVFYMQARSGRALHSVIAEKEQLRVLAERIGQVLDDTMERDSGAGIPTTTPDPLRDDDPLEAPIEAEFRVGALALGWNKATKRLIVEAHEAVEGYIDVPDLEEDPDDGPDCLRVRLTGSQARWFVERTLAVIAAGRPDCPFCHGPLDPVGHICPRANGYKR